MSAEPSVPRDLDPALPWDPSVRAAVDALPAISFVANEGGSIAWVSKRWYELTATPSDGDLDAAWLAALASDDRDVVRASWERARARGSRYEATVRMRMGDGQYRWFLMSAERMAHDDARFAWFGSTIEVTERHTAELAMEASEHEYRALADAMPQIVWTAKGEQTDYLNAQWYRYSGVDASESAEAGWALMLHPDDAGATLTRWRRCLATGENFEIENRLRGADGSYRWFLTRGTPYLDDDGTARKWFGTCTDIDDLRRRERAERFVSDAIALLARSGDVTENCKRVTSRAVASVATYCIVDLLRDNGRLERVAWAHAKPHLDIQLAELVNYPPSLDRVESPVARALGRHRATFVPQFNDMWARRTAVNDDHYRFLRYLRTSSLISVPLEAYGHDIGAITFCYADTDEAYNEVDLAAFADVGRRLGIAIESARASQHDRTVAKRFQRAALPKTLPKMERLRFDAVYHAALEDAEVGGDWYDAVVRHDGRVALSLGDVAGHDLDSAISMIGVRQSIRTAALFGHAPHEILETVNAATAGEAATRYVTVFVAVLDVDTGRLEYASAGHPPALVRRADGRTELLSAEAPPLGLFPASEGFAGRSTALAPGDMLVLYTDGLIEAERDIVAGEAALRATVASPAFAHAPSPAIHLRDRMLREPARDDVAILVVGYAPPERWTFEAVDAVGAQGSRVAFSRYVGRTCTPDSDIVGCEIIFGELIGNVVRHAPGPVEIVLEWPEGRAMLHVYDYGPGIAWSGPSLPEAYAEGGRGLYIISRLARSYFIGPNDRRGTHIAVELPVERRDREVTA